MLSAGTQLGHYRILRPLGSGGMADVYEASDLMLLRHVALKVLPSELARNPDFVQRFEKEVRAAASLDHSGIVTIYEVGHAESMHFYTMRLLMGGDLRARIKGGLGEGEALALLWEACDAFAHAHARGFVHRDVKPENIMFDESGRLVLTDFGIAKAMSGSTHMTATGVMIGTPRYMSPEQAVGKAVDPRADIYSLGVILFEMLCGYRPFEADEPLAVILKHVSEPIPRLPAALTLYQGLIDTLMAKEPDRRPTSCVAVQQLIEPLLPAQRTGPQSRSALHTGPGLRSHEWPTIATGERSGALRSSPPTPDSSPPLRNSDHTPTGQTGPTVAATGDHLRAEALSRRQAAAREALERKHQAEAAAAQKAEEKRLKSAAEAAHKAQATRLAQELAAQRQEEKRRSKAAAVEARRRQEREQQQHKAEQRANQQAARSQAAAQRAAKKWAAAQNTETARWSRRPVAALVALALAGSVALWWLSPRNPYEDEMPPTLAPAPLATEVVEPEAGTPPESAIVSPASNTTPDAPAPVVPAAIDPAPDNEAVDSPVQGLPESRGANEDFQSHYLREQEEEQRQRQMREQAQRQEEQLQQALRDQALRDEQLRQQALREQALREEEQRQRELREQALRQEEQRKEEQRQQALRDQALQDEQVRQQALREQVQREKERRQQELLEQAQRDEDPPALVAPEPSSPDPLLFPRGM